MSSRIIEILDFILTLRYSYYSLCLSSADQVLLADSKADDISRRTTLTPSAFNCVLYGLPNLIVT